MISTFIAVLFLLAGTALAMPKAKPEAVPEITSSILEGYFIEISKKANVFPDATSLYGRLMLRNEQFNTECLTVWGTSAGNGWAVLNTKCDGTRDNSLTWLKHAGNGKINLALKNTECIGSGDKEGSGVYTGDWCDSLSHQFVIQYIAGTNTFQLIQAETGMCLATDTNVVGDINRLIVKKCSVDLSEKRQNWRACDTTLNNCWPS